jgi:hypothetical protein
MYSYRLGASAGASSQYVQHMPQVIEEDREHAGMYGVNDSVAHALSFLRLVHRCLLVFFSILLSTRQYIKITQIRHLPRKMASTPILMAT